MIARIKNIIFKKGFVFTFLLSMFCLCYFYGKLLRHPNQTYFSAKGDGMQAYYVALYHVKHDASYWHMDGLNYPYGEQVFYSGCQPFVTNTIKLISHVVDISNYTLGILNLIMLLSIVLSALSLFLVFKQLKLPDFYSGVAATAIAYLSPQLDRMSGHFSLTYQFAIPLFIYLLMKFYERPTIKKSILISVLTFFMAGTHFYYFGFFAILSIFYWIALYFSENENVNKTKFAVKHFFIQLVLPYALLQGIIFLIDHVSDRTNFPWGYMTYISNWTGVFYPLNRYYTEWADLFFTPVIPAWEGRAFIGIIAVFSFLGIVVIVLNKFIRGKFRDGLMVTNNLPLSAFFWASLIALFLSFGCPFSGKGYEELLSESGPLKQLRGIGRFSWPFFYTINILAIYKLYQWASLKNYILKTILLAAILYVLCYDSFKMSKWKQYDYKHSIAELDDVQNQLPENNWLNKVETQNYQGIISLPYFHIGSENIWISPESEIIKDVFVASLKTGLPTTSLILSRVSLSQTYKNIQIVKGPYRPLEIVNDFKSDKPFLVLVKESELNEQEHFLLCKCKKLMNSKNYSIFELRTETLKHISDNLYNETALSLQSTKTFAIDEYLSTDSLKTFVFKNYEDLPNKNCYEGSGCYEGKFMKYNVLFKGGIPNMKDGEYSVSFWMGDFKTDIYPRCTLEFTYMDSVGQVYGTSYSNPSKSLTIVDGGWALIENKVKLKNKTDQLVVTLWHPEIFDENKLIHVDNLLVRPIETRIFRKISSKKIMLNNRTYIQK